MRGRTKFIRDDAHLFLALAIAFQFTLQGWSQEVKPVGITDIGGHVEIGLKYREDERIRSSVGSSSVTGEMRSHQTVRMDVDGYVLHPRFLEFFLGPEFEYFQQETTALGFEDQKTNDLLVGGDFRLTLFKEHPYTVSLYANQVETDVDRFFTKGFVTTRLTWGATVGVRKGPVPFTLDVNHTESSSTDSSAGIDEISDQLRLDGRYELGHLSGGDILYAYTLTDQESFARIVEEHQLIVNNVTYFDEKKRKQLTGNLRASQQSGSFESTSFSIEEVFFWKHTPKLSTSYDVRFDRAETGGSLVDIYAAGFAVDHQLYESLHSSLRLNAEQSNSLSSEISSYRGEISETYLKNMGAWGDLSLGVRLFSEVLDFKPLAETTEVSGESVRFDSLSPVQLTNIDIRRFSIRVTDVGRTRVYAVGRDYRLTSIGRRILISRVAFGRIPEGATVLVSYDFDSGMARTVLTTGGTFYSRLSWGKLLSIKALYEGSSQTASEEAPLGTLEELTRWALGFESYWRWLSGGADYEDRNSTITPSRTLTEWILVTGSPLPRWQARLGVTHQWIEYYGTGEEIDSWNVQGSLVGQITRRIQASLEAEYRQQRWTPETTSNDIDYYGLRGSLRWQFRKILVEAKAFYLNTDQQGQFESKTRFDLIFRRDF